MISLPYNRPRRKKTLFSKHLRLHGLVIIQSIVMPLRVTIAPINRLGDSQRCPPFAAAPLTVAEIARDVGSIELSSRLLAVFQNKGSVESKISLLIY